MKKAVKIIAIFASLTVLAFSGSGCSYLGDMIGSQQSSQEEQSSVVSVQQSEQSEQSQESSTPESSQEESSEESVQESSEESSSESSTDENEFSLPEESKRLEYVFNHPQFQSGVKQMEESLSNSTQTTKLSLASSDTMVVTATATTQLDNLDTYKKYFEQLTNESSSYFTKFVKDMEEATQLENLYLIVRYNNADGTTIYERSFTSLDTTVDESSVEESSSETSKVQTSSGNKMFATLDDLMQNESFKDTIESQLKQYESDEYNVNLYVEDKTKFVYDIQFYDEVSSSAGDQLSSYLDSVSSIYESIASTINSQVDDEISVIVRYKDLNGKVIAEKEYFAE